MQTAKKLFHVTTFMKQYMSIRPQGNLWTDFAAQSFWDLSGTVKVLLATLDTIFITLIKIIYFPLVDDEMGPLTSSTNTSR